MYIRRTQTRSPANGEPYVTYRLVVSGCALSLGLMHVQSNDARANRGDVHGVLLERKHYNGCVLRARAPPGNGHDSRWVTATLKAGPPARIPRRLSSSTGAWTKPLT